MAVPKKKTSKAKSRSRGRAPGASSARPAASAPAATRPSCPTSCAATAAGTAAGWPSRSTERPRPTATLSDQPDRMLPDRHRRHGRRQRPGAIVEGARAAAELGVPVVLVGGPRSWPRLRGDLEVIPGLAGHRHGRDDPGSSVRTMKDSSLVRAAEAVRDGRASAMVSAGNTGATMASALLRMGRIKGVSRPAIATPIPVPGSTPTVLLDAGANAECQPAWLVQFAQMGAVFARERYGIAEPRVGLLSIGEEPTKGNPLVKETHALLAERRPRPGGAASSATSRAATS